jgi:hypothetical protein
VARALKQFIAAVREQDDELTILSLSGIGNNLCISSNVPNTKFGIEQYFRHEVNLTISMANLVFVQQRTSGS